MGNRFISVRRLALLLVCIFAGTALQAQKKVIIELRKDADANKVEVFTGGDFFTAFFQPEKVEKPVFWPVVSPGGHEITRAYPLKIREGERVDHPHQAGIWFNFGDVNGIDFWNNSDAVPADKKSGYGTIKLQSVNTSGNGKKEARLFVNNSWQDHSGNTLLEEKTTFVFKAGEDLRIIDRTTTLTAVGGEVVFTDNKEGLMAIRVATELEMPARGNIEVTRKSGEVSTVPAENRPGISGNYISSEGVSGENVWGTKGGWVQLSGIIDGERVTLAIIDHPSNPGYPTYWHARGYGLFSANNLGKSVFSENEKQFSLTLAPERKVTFRYRIVVAQGSLGKKEMRRLVNSFVNCSNCKLFSREW